MIRTLLFALLFALSGCLEPSTIPPRPLMLPEEVGADAGVADGGVAYAGHRAEPPPRGAVRVTTANLRRFFDTVCDSGSCGGDAYEALPTEAQFEARAQQIAEAIDGLESQIVLLQEVETQRCLDALTARLPRYRTAVLGEIGTPASVDVAVLSEFELLEVRTHRHQPIYRPDGSETRFSRELLEVHLDAGGVRVIVFTAHFRSKVNDDPGRRIAEAQAAREIVLASATGFPEALIVLGGDLNDTPDSEPLQILNGDGAFERPAEELAPGGDATYSYAGAGLAIDHLFRARSAAGAYLAGSVRIVRNPGQRGFAGSDHAAVRADFLTRE